MWTTAFYTLHRSKKVTHATTKNKPRSDNPSNWYAYVVDPAIHEVVICFKGFVFFEVFCSEIISFQHKYINF